MQVVLVSEQIKEMLPVWAGFIVGLGYTKEQGEKFAQGYADAVKKLPLVGKMMALANQYDPCMTAGFKAAGIDEQEAITRANTPKKRPRAKPKPAKMARRKAR
ncbi:MAG TPA: hypothetical protein VJ694_04880 [Patescibacteria group bacterium]|nr:hypothetical protein [Patescibacteria group bacterium]